MTLSKRVVWTAVAVLIAGAAAGGYYWFRRAEDPAVAIEAVWRRDLEAIVSASGTIQPKRSVNISADTIGRVTKLDVEEGNRVARGQFLLQIDPEPLRSSVRRSEAGVGAARAALQQARAAVETAEANLELSRTTLQRQRDLWTAQLTTREALDRAESELAVREAELRARRQEVAAREQQVRQEQAALESNRYELSKVTIVAPIDGIVTRRSIEEGETVVVGTMNNPGTVLLTIADMSEIEAQIEVDETSIPTVAPGQPATVSIDALPDRTFRGHVTDIGNSPIQQNAGSQAGSTTRQATTFKVVVTLDEPVPGVRPGFTCTADITTATRRGVVAVPIQAVAVREVVYDPQGRLVRKPAGSSSGRNAPAAAAPATTPGETRQEAEGVFVLRDGRAVFTPISVGIAGERYFEALSGLEERDVVITGPFESVRTLADGDRVRVEPPDR